MVKGNQAKNLMAFTPSKEEMARYQKLRQTTNYVQADKALDSLFGRGSRKPFDESDILLKCTALNTLYKTRIGNVTKLAKEYYKIFKQENVSKLLASGDPKAVEKLRKVKIGKDDKEWNMYSFATKFCSFCNPDAYPIYDKFVDEMLWHLKERGALSFSNRKDLKDYATFVSVINDLKRHYALGKASYRQIDNMLWLAGKEFFE